MQKQSLETKLNKALMDEYHARHTYRKIIDTMAAVEVALFNWNPLRDMNKG